MNSGESVALSAEGKDALMGGASDNKGIGAAWVFTRSVTTWTQQGEKLTGKEEIGEGELNGTGEFAYSVAMSPDGNTALIGAPNDNGGVGAAWVFTRASEKWTQQGAKLTGKEEAGMGEFGKSVALSAESESKMYAVIGGPADNAGVGAAWVLVRTAGVWTQQGTKLTAKAGEETGAGEFGSSVALAATKGEYALVGAPGDKEKIGAAWVFLRTGTTWAQQGAKLVAKAGEETGAGEFGKSVALSPDGVYGLMGAPGDKESIGAAWTFLRTGTTWAQQAKLVAKAGEETGAGSFGYSVALSAEVESKTYALIGAPNDNANVGTAWVFLRTTTTWTQQAKLVATGETGTGEFGKSVALAATKGEYALIGGPGDNAGIGAAWVFLRTGTTWAQQGAKLTGSGEAGPGELGFGVALSAEGKDAFIGGPADTGKVGAAWVFTRTGTEWKQQGEKLIAKPGEEIGPGESTGGKGEFGYSLALSSDGNTALIGGRADLHVGAAWVFTRSGSTWTQQGPRLTGAGESGAGEFGRAVALSSDGNTALIGGSADNSGVGAAWVFTRSGSVWTPAGRQSSPAAARASKANSARAWRCPPTATPR